MLMQVYVDGKPVDYMANELGEVYSNKTRKILKPRPAKNGYLRVGIVYTKHGKTVKKDLAIHRLVAQSFIPNNNPVLLTDVNHKDGNKTNNRVENLEWVSHKANMVHASENFLFKKGEDFGVHTPEQIKTVCELLCTNMPKKEIAKVTGVAYHAIIAIYYRKAWVYISKNYDFNHEKANDCEFSKRKIKIESLFLSGFSKDAIAHHFHDYSPEFKKYIRMREKKLADRKREFSKSKFKHLIYQLRK